MDPINIESATLKGAGYSIKFCKDGRAIVDIDCDDVQVSFEFTGGDGSEKSPFYMEYMEGEDEKFGGCHAAVGWLSTLSERAVYVTHTGDFGSYLLRTRVRYRGFVFYILEQPLVIIKSTLGKGGNLHFN